MRSSPRCCTPIYQIQMCSCILTHTAAGAMHHRQTEGNQAAFTITRSSALKTRFHLASPWCPFICDEVVLGGASKDKSRAGDILMRARQVTEGSATRPPCRGTDTPPFKRWRGQQRPSERLLHAAGGHRGPLPVSSKCEYNLFIRSPLGSIPPHPAVGAPGSFLHLLRWAPSGFGRLPS